MAGKLFDEPLGGKKQAINTPISWWRKHREQGKIIYLQARF